MRRIRRIFTGMLIFTLFAASGICARAESATGFRDVSDGRDPYRPVKVESYTWGDFDEIRILRTYQLSPADDPERIPVSDFEDHGWVYHMTEMTSEEVTATETKPLIRTVTLSSETNDMEKILRKLDGEIHAETDDGYAGTLRLDHTSVRVEASGYDTRSAPISVTRLYPDLADADLSLIPKTIEDGGKTLTLEDVKWENVRETGENSAFTGYDATATYLGTSSTRYATGYTVTADYTGEVARSDVEMITWRVEFAPIREAETVKIPPVPTAGSENDSTEDFPETDTSTNVSETSDDTENVENTDNSTNFEAYATPIPEETAPATVLVTPTTTPIPERTQTTPDFSRLIRSLLSCGLLLILAGALYLIRKRKRLKGGPDQN